MTPDSRNNQISNSALKLSAGDRCPSSPVVVESSSLASDFFTNLPSFGKFKLWERDNEQTHALSLSLNSKFSEVEISLKCYSSAKGKLYFESMYLIL